MKFKMDQYPFVRWERVTMSANNTGKVGVNWQQVASVEQSNVSHSYSKFIMPKSKGLTLTGQKLLQQCVESFMYAILGAQARTRWPIVGQGAKSLQTQDVFSQDVFWKIVNDTIFETDDTTAIRNMRQAIDDTNVILNTAIMPGVVLIPNRMIILDKKIAGFNNTLTIANLDMKFGVNSQVNFFTLSPTLPKHSPPCLRSATAQSTTPSPTLPKHTTTHAETHVSTSSARAKNVVSTSLPSASTSYILLPTVVFGAVIAIFLI